MVAIIKTGHSVHRILNYNENKVKLDVAECIGAGNYPVDHDKMSFNMKLNRLLNQCNMNENVSRNSVHISLNFHASEKDFSHEKLNDIAKTYMNKIGFGNQPYLVYTHNDAGHPHLHIVSIKVRSDGSRIDVNNIGRNQSEVARKSIEQEFGLIKAEDQKLTSPFQIKPIAASKALYGKVQTKIAIQNVLEAVLPNYHYSSLPELNAVLKQYNVMADRGTEKSKTYQYNGLLYHILDNNGNPVGVPIKASLFYSKPTLKFLDKRFAENAEKPSQQKARIKNIIDKAVMDKNVTLSDLGSLLEKQGINMTIRRNTEGIIFGITYVDHQTKYVFNGSSLGKQYSAKALQERCKKEHISVQDGQVLTAQKSIGLQPQANASAAETKAVSNTTTLSILLPDAGKLIDDFLKPELPSDFIPGQLKKKKKKKKRRNLDNR